MAKCRKKPIIIDATQWHKGEAPLDCKVSELKDRHNGRYSWNIGGGDDLVGIEANRVVSNVLG